MHKCQFCDTEYQSRVQVKNPRACPRLACQNRRQRTNEREWRARSGQRSDPTYHRIRRQQRRKMLQKIIQALLDCLEVGSRFLNRTFDSEGLSLIVNDFISDLGVRRANKLCRFEIKHDYEDIGKPAMANFMQTS